jgi:hypothetical protein
MAPYRGYKQNGLKLLRRKVALRGLRAIDWRSAGAQACLEWRNELVDALGTEENLSAQKRTLIDYAMRTKLFLDHIDGFLLQEESFIFRGKKSAWPLLMQRMTLLASLERTLSTLGLERQAKKLPTLEEYLEKRESESATTQSPPQPTEPIDISTPPCDSESCDGTTEPPEPVA